MIWKSEKRKLKDLIPWDKNPRKFSNEEKENLEKSLDRFDLADPIIINTDNLIIGGHFRYRILKERGVEEVDVRVPERKLTDAEVEELNLRLNKNLGEFDNDRLVDFDKDLLREVGFNNDELDDIFAEVDEDKFDAKKEYEDIKEPVTKKGDIIKLGNHCLMCGDSTKTDDVKKLMGGNKAQLVFTDPPYNIGYDYGSIYKDGKKVKAKKVFSDKKSDSEFIDFLTSAFGNCFAFSTKDSSFYCWYGVQKMELFQKAFNNSGYRIRQVLIWLKDRLRLTGTDYHRIYEPCAFGDKGKKHFKNKKVGAKASELILLNYNDFQEVLDVIYSKRDQEYSHPTQKPIRLAERAIKYHSARDNVVLDVFGGSGSTMLACEQLDRKCYMMELDPKYCDVIIKRWEQFTGEKAERQQTS